uniref:Lipoprotein n=1 Tax=Rubinisphaera brasiliensis (strain ATCC 49424 / DSM 5305 / JCM 21570 / IAM 15109 / NBRC 103401 / IFAM 1448) TaxID=756272 RepID=F0SHF4_RUBBR|nr:hypothetical protein Plabr_4134 [Rubinisphaera brasiliensis DSM 5305]
MRNRSCKVFPFQWSVFAALITAPLFFAGCGPDPEVLKQQDQAEAKAYEEAARNPPNLPPEIEERRRYRMKMDFGVTSDSAPASSEGGKD